MVMISWGPHPPPTSGNLAATSAPLFRKTQGQVHRPAAPPFRAPCSQIMSCHVMWSIAKLYLYLYLHFSVCASTSTLGAKETASPTRFHQSQSPSFETRHSLALRNDGESSLLKFLPYGSVLLALRFCFASA